jgi:hypothetical protein
VAHPRLRASEESVVEHVGVPVVRGPVADQQHLRQVRVRALALESVFDIQPVSRWLVTLQKKKIH